MKVNSNITILYPLSPSYSGSTLLSLLLGNQNEVYGAGELFIFSKHPQRLDALAKGRCSCNQKQHSYCVFWTKINDYLLENYQLQLHDLNVESDDVTELKVHNEYLFQAIHFITGCSIIIDSSKIVSRFVQLRAAGFRVIPIRLLRHPFAVVHSWSKRQFNWWNTAHYYASFYKEVAQNVPDRKNLEIHYEDFVQQPAAYLRQILTFLELKHEPINLDWTQQEYHHLKGNPMRFKKEAKIQLSTAWKTEITIWQKWIITFLAFPVRFDQYWFYYVWERFARIFIWRNFR